MKSLVDPKDDRITALELPLLSDQATLEMLAAFVVVPDLLFNGTMRNGPRSLWVVFTGFDIGMWWPSTIPAKHVACHSIFGLSISSVGHLG